jgi:hypothetical protein
MDYDSIGTLELQFNRFKIYELSVLTDKHYFKTFDICSNEFPYKLLIKIFQERHPIWW